MSSSFPSFQDFAPFSAKANVLFSCLGASASLSGGYQIVLIIETGMVAAFPINLSRTSPNRTAPDLSRIKVGGAVFSATERRPRKAFDDMATMSGDGIANSGENRLNGHYRFRNCAPTEMPAILEEAVIKIQNFATRGHVEEIQGSSNKKGVGYGMPLAQKSCERAKPDLGKVAAIAKSVTRFSMWEWEDNRAGKRRLFEIPRIGLQIYRIIFYI